MTSDNRLVLSSWEVVVLSSTLGKHKKICQKIIFDGKIKVKTRFRDDLWKSNLLTETKNLEKITVKSLPDWWIKFFHLISRELTSATATEHDSTDGTLEVSVRLSRSRNFCRWETPTKPCFEACDGTSQHYPINLWTIHFVLFVTKVLSATRLRYPVKRKVGGQVLVKF